MKQRIQGRRATPDPAAAAAVLKRKTRQRPVLGLVLGSGFGATAQALDNVESLPYAALPGFPRPSVSGHAGKLMLGQLAETPVLVLSGRAHYYEGHSPDEVTFAMRVLAAFGVTDVLLTNAAGGVNARFRPGDFMLLRDHINFMGVNPLRGPAPIVQMSGTPTRVQRASPALGEHTDSILANLGYSDDEVAAMREKGVVG